PRSEGMPKRLLGTMTIQGDIEPVQMEQSDEKAIDPQKAVRQMEGLKELQEAGGAKEAERVEKLKALQEKYAGKPMGLLVSQYLSLAGVGQEAPADALRSAADHYIKEAAKYGPELEANAAYQVAQAAARADKASPLALEYAQKAAKLVGDGPPARVA